MLMKLFTINGVYIKEFSKKMKLAWNAVLLSTGKIPFK